MSASNSSYIILLVLDITIPLILLSPGTVQVRIIVTAYILFHEEYAIYQYLGLLEAFSYCSLCSLVRVVR